MKLIQTKDYLLLIDEEANINFDTDYVHCPDTSLFTGFSINKITKEKADDAKNKVGFSFYKIIAYYPLHKDAKELNLALLPSPYKEEVDLLSYINKLQNQKFDGWSNDECKGYLTALISISEFTKVNNKQYTEENLMRAYDSGRYAIINKDIDETFDSFMKSLSTSTLPVEFIPEYLVEKGWQGEWNEYNPTNKLKTTIKDNKTYLVGEYKY